MIKTLRQRIERVLMFAGELAQSTRREFGTAWRASSDDDQLAELQSRVESLQLTVEQVRVQYLRARNPIPSVELAALQAIDLASLTQLARGLEPLAREIRARAEAARQAAEPAQPHLPSGLLDKLPGGRTGRLAQWANSPQVREAAAVGLNKARAIIAAANEAGEVAERKAATPPVDVGYTRSRQAFEAAFKLASEILGYVTPRLALVRVALATTGLPGRKAPWDQVASSLLPAAKQAGIPNGHVARLAHITKLVYADLNATRKAHQAVVQLDEANALHGDAELLDGNLPKVEPPVAKAMLGRFDVAKYRAAIFPLSHLHVAFKGTPHLEELFPPPAGVATTATLGAQA